MKLFSLLLTRSAPGYSRSNSKWMQSDSSRHRSASRHDRMPVNSLQPERNHRSVDASVHKSEHRGEQPPKGHKYARETGTLFHPKAANPKIMPSRILQERRTTWATLVGTRSATSRSRLDDSRAPIGPQQRSMSHADVATTAKVWQSSRGSKRKHNSIVARKVLGNA